MFIIRLNSASMTVDVLNGKVENGFMGLSRRLVQVHSRSMVLRDNFTN